MDLTSNLWFANTDKSGDSNKKFVLFVGSMVKILESWGCIRWVSEDIESCRSGKMSVERAVSALGPLGPPEAAVFYQPGPVPNRQIQPGAL
jgi:hypothetical protein